MIPREWPYNLPIWRRCHRATSPDGAFVARIDPAWEVSMGNPTSGSLEVSNGLVVPRCNPSFIWSDDSRFLAVPAYFTRFGSLNRQRLLVIAFHEERIYASRMTAWYFQPETFVNGKLVATINPFGGRRTAEFVIPDDLGTSFTTSGPPWPRTSLK